MKSRAKREFTKECNKVIIKGSVVLCYRLCSKILVNKNSFQARLFYKINLYPFPRIVCTNLGFLGSISIFCLN